MSRSDAKFAGAVLLAIIMISAVIVSMFKEWFEAHVGTEILGASLFGSCLAWAIWGAISEQFEDRT